VAVDADGGAAPDMRILQCGDAGLLLEFPDLTTTRRMFAALERTPPAGTTDLVPAAVTLLVRFDPAVTDPAQIERVLRTTTADPDETASGELVHIPVRYDGADLDDVAAHTGLGPRQVIEAHAGRDWTVAFAGFAPGFAYLVNGDPRLAVPRRAESRTRVPAGAVGLAGGFSCVYPRGSPGGWQLIGHTEADMWDIEREPPALLLPGSTVRFHEVPA
jgi:KipI family sensor histidine kinase inhibitor